MLTAREMLLGILLPLIASGALGAVAWLTRCAWLLPLAIGVGFCLGYTSSGSAGGGFGLPRFPPTDGTDWLFWTTLPAVVLAMLASRLLRHYRALPAAWAGVIVWAIAYPLVPASLSTAAQLIGALLAAVTAPVLVYCLMIVARRIGDRAVIAGLAITVFGAGVLVLSSNLRTTGVYGLGAGAALAPAVLFARRLSPAGLVCILAFCLLAGLLACGHFYPEPGVTLLQCLLVSVAPLGLLLALTVSPEHPRRRSIVGVLTVAVIVAAVVAPAAIAAMRAAGADPYAIYDASP